MITLTDKRQCTGCTACAAVCPTGAIAMQEDREGFLSPVIDDSKCISCKKCLNVCPADNVPSKVEPLVFAARAKDEEILKVSSSGGIFSLLARLILEDSGLVCGAGFDEDFSVVHRFVDKTEDVPRLTGSKYVQSRMDDSFKMIERELRSGRRVMFVGTPCQCAGLKAFLGRDYEDLLIVDFVCHGVPSPKLYKKYLAEISNGKEITNVNFRCKIKDSGSYEMGMDFADSTVYRSKVAKDPYMMAFAQDISLRSSCYRCFSKGLHSAADLTLGDFWGIDETDSPLSKKTGVSLVLVNTEKGKNAFDKIQDSLETDCRNPEEAYRKNPCIVTSVKKNPLRDKFLRDMDKLSINKLTEKYCGSSYFAKFRRVMARLRKDT